MRKLTPVLVVDAIEPCLPFWVDRLAFQQVAEVPHGDVLGFVILVREGVEIMYQTRASIAADAPSLGDLPAGGAALFIEVDDVAAVEAAMAGLAPVLPRRQTFYGMDEIGFREPGGSVVTFAQRIAS